MSEKVPGEAKISGLFAEPDVILFIHFKNWQKNKNLLHGDEIENLKRTKFH